MNGVLIQTAGAAVEVNMDLHEMLSELRCFVFMTQTYKILKNSETNGSVAKILQIPATQGKYLVHTTYVPGTYRVCSRYFLPTQQVCDLSVEGEKSLHKQLLSLETRSFDKDRTF